MVPRLSFVGVRVAELGPAESFYRHAVGVPLRSDRRGTHQEFSWHDPYLHFALFPPSMQPKAQLFVGFQVADLEAAEQQANAADAEPVAPKRQEPWGWTAAYRDPDGNVVQLVERRD
jgi:predicted enzyme related to lactoylglutathione lyase